MHTGTTLRSRGAEVRQLANCSAESARAWTCRPLTAVRAQCGIVPKPIPPKQWSKGALNRPIRARTSTSADGIWPFASGGGEPARYAGSLSEQWTHAPGTAIASPSSLTLHDDIIADAVPNPSPSQNLVSTTSLKMKAPLNNRGFSIIREGCANNVPIFSTCSTIRPFGTNGFHHTFIVTEYGIRSFVS
jgi:hypothetical protein